MMCEGRRSTFTGRNKVQTITVLNESPKIYFAPTDENVGVVLAGALESTGALPAVDAGLGAIAGLVDWCFTGGRCRFGSHRRFGLGAIADLVDWCFTGGRCRFGCHRFSTGG